MEDLFIRFFKQGLFALDTRGPYKGWDVAFLRHFSIWINWQRPLSFPANYFRRFVYNLGEFLSFKFTDLVKDDMAISSEDTIRPYIARLLETPRFKVAVIKRNGILVPHGLAGYLTEYYIITLKSCND